MSNVYLVFVVLSTIVAAIGLMKDNVAIIIGAMVIAPFLGPSVALALSATLGDNKLRNDALKATIVGFLAFTTGASAVVIGVMVAVALLPPLTVFGLLMGSEKSKKGNPENTGNLDNNPGPPGCSYPALEQMILNNLLY
jgi:uncharacterized membrane protein